MGNKLYVPCGEVKYLFVPHYESLSIIKILAESQRYPQVARYLPDPQDLARVNRQWLCNVINSVVGKPFADWVEAQVQDRNQKLAVKNDF